MQPTNFASGVTGSSPFATVRRASAAGEQSDDRGSAPEVARITSREQVPKGDILDLTKLAERPLASMMASQFVVVLQPASNPAPGEVLGQSDSLQTGHKGIISILWCPEHTDSRAAMEVRTRLKLNGYQSYVMVNLQATAELVRLINERLLLNDTDGEQLPASEVQKYASELILKAEAMGASDVHIHIYPHDASILFRVHGKLLLQAEITAKRAMQAGHFWYAWQSTDNTRDANWVPTKIANTQFVLDLPGSRGQLTVRFHSAPMHPQGSVQIVMRLLRPASSADGYRPLDKVGYDESQLSLIEERLSAGKGLILLGGPTNSGKSSSLQSFVAAVRAVRSDLLKIPTIEDPVEYEMPGACQMASTADEFADYLKATLRQDPDLVVVGEIRSPEAANIVKDIVLAGFPTYSTLHMGSAVSAFNRIEQLKLPREVLSDPGFISAVIFQRLVPQLCPHCSLKWEEALEEELLVQSFYNRALRVFSTAQLERLRFHNLAGCSHCNNTGLIGRVPCAEVLVPDDQFLTYIREGRSDLASKYWHDQLGKPIGKFGPSALAHGISNALKGLCDPRELEPAVGLLTNVLVKP